MNSQELDEVTAGFDDIALNQPTSRFCLFMTKLPREIREMIYGHLVVGPGPVVFMAHVVNCRPLVATEPKPFFTNKIVKRIVALQDYPRGTLNRSLFDVCRRMREECLAICFRLSKLQFSGARNLPLLFIKISPEYLRLLSYISINCSHLGAEKYLRRPWAKPVPRRYVRACLKGDISKIAAAFRELAECHKIHNIVMSVPPEVAYYLGREFEYSCETMQALVKEIMVVRFAKVGLQLGFNDSEKEKCPCGVREDVCMSWDRKRQ